MKLPQSNVIMAKSALQSLWEDTVTVNRHIETAGVEGSDMVYSNVLCHLSIAMPPVTSQTDTASVANVQFTLYVDTGIDIKQGDALTITHKAQTIQGVAGLPFKRNFSNVIKVESVVYA